MRSKTLLSVFALVVLAALLGRAEGVTGLAVTNTAIRLVPPSGVYAAPDWATGTAYAQGVVVSAEARTFMCLVPGGGTSTNSPALGGTTADGYRWVEARQSPRKGLIIENLSATGDLYVSESANVSSTNGLRLAGGGAVTFPAPNAPAGSFYVISPSGTNIAAYYEW